MFLAAGEILHGRAVAFVRERAQVHLQAFESILNAGLVGAFAEDGVRFGMLDESLQRVGRAGTGDEKIEIADGVLTAPQAAGCRDFFDAAGFGKIGDQLAGHLLSEVEQEAAGALAILRDGLEHLLFQLGAHARQLAQLLLLADALQLVDGGDFVVLVNQRDALRAEALDLEQLEQRGRELRQQRVALFKRAALGEFGEHAGDAFADAGNFGDLALGVGENIVDALGKAFDGGSGVAIGADAKAVFARNLHQVRGFGEHAREFTIFHSACLSWAGGPTAIVPSMCGST